MENFRIVINHAALNSGLIDAVNLTERGIDHRHNHDMKSPTNPYAGFRFPTEIISHAVWLYHRFTLSFREVEEILAERGIIVSHETIRQGVVNLSAAK